jgi:hypothetical protein
MGRRRARLGSRHPARARATILIAAALGPAATVVLHALMLVPNEIWWLITTLAGAVSGGQHHAASHALAARPSLLRTPGTNHRLAFSASGPSALSIIVIAALLGVLARYALRTFWPLARPPAHIPRRPCRRRAARDRLHVEPPRRPAPACPAGAAEASPAAAARVARDDDHRSTCGPPGRRRPRDGPRRLPANPHCGPSDRKSASDGGDHRRSTPPHRWTRSPSRRRPQRAHDALRRRSLWRARA